MCAGCGAWSRGHWRARGAGGRGCHRGAADAQRRMVRSTEGRAKRGRWRDTAPNGGVAGGMRGSGGRCRQMEAQQRGPASTGHNDGGCGGGGREQARSRDTEAKIRSNRFFPLIDGIGG